MSLRSSTHTRPFSVSVGVAITCEDRVARVTANSAPRPVFSPRERVPPTTVAVAGPRHDRRADDGNIAYVWVTPASRHRSPPPSRVLPGYSFASLSITLLAGVSTRGMAYWRSPLRTLRPSVAAHPDCCSFPRTGITDNGARLEQRILGLVHCLGDQSALPRRSRTPGALHPHCSPARLKRVIKHAVGEQATIRLNKVVSHDSGFGTPELLEEPHPHPIPDPAPVVPQWKLSALPIIEDDDDMVFVATEVVAGTPPIEGRGETSSRGITATRRAVVVVVVRAGANDEVVIGADEHKRSRTGHGGFIARRRSFEDDKRRPGSMMRLSSSIT